MRLAWRNLGRNRKRTALALGAIALAQTTLLFMNGFTQSYVDVTFDAITGPLVGHVQVHAPLYREERGLDQTIPNLGATLAAVRADAGVASAAARIWSPVLVAKKVDAMAAVVVGVEPEHEGGPTGLLGRSTGTAALGDRRVLVGRKLALDLGVTVGDELALVGQGADGSIANDVFEVAGVLSTPLDMLNRMGLVVALADAQTFLALGDEAHEIVVRAKVAEEAAPLAARLGALPPLAGLETLPWKQIVPELANILEISDRSTVIVVIIVFIASAAGIANTMLMATFERSHELGMLLALGCGPGRIVRMILAESVMLGLLGVALGTAAGAALVALAGRYGIDLAALSSDPSVSEMSYEGIVFSFKLFPRIVFKHVAQGVTAVLVTAVLAALWPALHAARMHPVEAMRA